MTSTMSRLSAMMFLQFFIWGAWFVTLGTYLVQGPLQASASQVATAFLSQSIGAIVAPFLVGLIADRYFAAQRILAVLHLAGAALMWMASTATSFGVFSACVMIYMLLFMPTLALANSIAMRHMQAPEKQFPPVRVAGSIGWIVAGVLIGWLGWEQAHRLELTFRMAAAASLALGLYALTLPNTPPLEQQRNATLGQILGLDALRLLKSRSYLVFFLASIAICIPLSFYYNFTNPYLNDLGVRGAAGLQSLGQVSEVLLMLAMPFLFARLGVKTMLALGMAAWVLRYVLFAYGDAGAGFALLVSGIVLHGICYDFFFVTGQIYTDAHAGPASRSSAQGFITLATYGVGMLIGSFLSGAVVEHYTTAAGRDWQQIWLFPAGVALAVLVAFVFLFRERPVATSVESSASSAH
ncbi:nucleoside permease [Lysobacter capsici]|uniref:nucleoside permease n=1 Tax=Lysobacter capsici TaxID=435897 RepID=UPI00287B6C25|nr:nucleoside permease [Lysobacter capsici]WND80044.1 nucleoside permease [Lysobacter capsici]WND85240.1 nucleoside permease [Lysobacter capsici]